MVPTVCATCRRHPVPPERSVCYKCVPAGRVSSYEGIAEIKRDRDSYREALQMIAQIIHGSTRTTHMIAEAALAGADFTDPDVAMAVCEGKWRKP